MWGDMMAASVSENLTSGWRFMEKKVISVTIKP
jgi:hypothetical protein